MRYVALLRGINVGGKNKVAMPILKKAFEEYGFTDVSTYINSGNVLFTATENTPDVLQNMCQNILKDIFHLDIAVCIMPASVFLTAVENSPLWWGSDKQSKHNAIFVIQPFKADAIMAEVGAIKPEYEKISCYGNVLFWSAPLSTFSKTRWAKVASSKTYSRITIRNANTTRKIAELLKK